MYCKSLFYSKDCISYCRKVLLICPCRLSVTFPFCKQIGKFKKSQKSILPSKEKKFPAHSKIFISMCFYFFPKESERHADSLIYFKHV